MQDPFLNLVPEQSLDLNTLFSPGENGTSSSDEEFSDQSVSLEDVTPDATEMQEVEEIIEKYKEEGNPQTTLEERIKKTEEEYNEIPIPIYGRMQKRLMTLAKRLTKDSLNRQAQSLLELIDRE